MLDLTPALSSEERENMIQSLKLISSLVITNERSGEWVDHFVIEERGVIYSLSPFGKRVRVHSD